MRNILRVQELQSSGRVQGDVDDERIVEREPANDNEFGIE
jgi:hypothetical protein